MDKRTDLSQLTTEALETELAQRRSRERVAEDSYAVEVGLEAEAHQYVATQLDAYYTAREATQMTARQPCPRCGQLCRVRRPARTITTARDAGRGGSPWTSRSVCRTQAT